MSDSSQGKHRSRPRPAHPNRPARSDTAAQARLVRKQRTVVSCHYCGYDGEDIRTDRPCPKCGMDYWETVVIAERLLPEDA